LDADGDGQPDSGLPLGGAPGLVGPAGTIAYTLYYSNTGSAPAPGVTVSLTPHGGLVLDGATSLDLGEIPAGGGGSWSFTAHIDPAYTGTSAELRLQAADTRHGPFEWLWSLHPVDNQPPSSVQIRRPVQYFRPGPVTIYGVASDPSGVPQLELKADNGTPWSCIDSTPLDGAWSCAWDASSYTTDGQQVSLTARAADPYYHWSIWSAAHTLTVDTVAPSVQLSSASQAALDDGLLLPSELILSGTVTDGRQAAGVKICAETTGGDAALCRTAGAKPSGNPQTAAWALAVPVLGDGDGVLENIKIFGLDAAGNASTSPLAFDSIRVDVTGPVLQVTTQASYAFQAQKITVLAGTIRDGSGVNALRLRRMDPNGALAWIPLTFTNGAWKYEASFALPGSYTFSLEAVDQHGNTTRSGLYQLTVYRSDQVADLSVSLASAPTPAISGLTQTYTFTVKNAGPGPASGSELVIDLPVQVTWETLPEGCTNPSGQQVICTLGAIAKDAQVTRTLAVQVDADSTTGLECKASVSTTTPELNLADNQPLPLFTRLVQPVVGLVATATSPTPVGTPTTFTAEVSAGTDVVFDWDFGDETAGSGPMVTHVYTPKTGGDPGIYTATVTAHNEYNSLTATVEVKLGSRPPVLDLTGQSQVMFEDEPVQIARLPFSDPDQPDSHTATIDWGDGGGQIPIEVKTLVGGGYIYGVHTYPEPGVYTVKVVVTDSYQQSAIGSFTVTVIHGFMRTCAYAGDSNPGVTVYPDARMDCPWTPAGPAGEVRSSGVGSRYELYVRDRAVVSGTLASQTGDIILFPDVQVITSTAGTEFNLFSSGDVFAGGKAEVLERTQVGGNLTSGDSVLLLTDAYIAGDVTATGIITISPGAAVGGVVSPDTPVPPLPEVTQVSFSFEPGKKDVTVGKGKTYTLKPGEYDDLKVGDSSALNLSSGHYTFNTITVSKNARLELDLSGGPILVDAVKYISLADSVQMEITSATGRPEDILFRLMGNNLTLGSGGVYLGTFLAPWASAILGDSASLTGAIYGGKVSIFFNALVTGRPARDLFADTFVNEALLP